MRLKNKLVNGLRLFLVAGVMGSLLSISVEAEELRTVRHEFIPESGCPVTMTGGKTELEVDSFGAPLACRIFLDFKNESQRAVQGVKFRIGYCDHKGSVLGSFHAPDGTLMGPGATGAGRWKGERVDPRTSVVKVRVLQVKYSDGSLWESEKMKGDQVKRIAPIAKPPDQGGGGSEQAASEGGQQTGAPSTGAPAAGNPADGQEAPQAPSGPASGGY